MSDSGGACLDCKRRYGDRYGFPDLVVSDETWAAIHPEGQSGLLCPSCICARAYAAGVSGRAEFTSGPFAVRDHVAEADALRKQVRG